jgi:hypothetical protein
MREFVRMLVPATGEMQSHLLDLFQMEQPIDLALVPGLCALVKLVPSVDVSSLQGRQVVPQCIFAEIVFPYRPDGVLAFRVDVRTVIALFAGRYEFAGRA